MNTRWRTSSTLHEDNKWELSLDSLMPGFTDTHTIESQPIKKDSQPSNSVISRVENMTHYTLQIERVL